MKKVIVLTFMLIMISSSLVFATEPTTYPSESGYNYCVVIESGNGTYKALYSTTPFYKSLNYNDLETSNSTLNVKYRSYNSTTNVWSPISNTNSPSWAESFISISTSTHNIYIKGTSTLFMKALSPLEVGMEGAQQNLLSQILLILPIILGMCLLVIGFRKAWTMLSRILGRA